MARYALSNPDYVLPDKSWKGCAFVADAGGNTVYKVAKKGNLSPFYVLPVVNTGACAGIPNNDPTPDTEDTVDELLADLGFRLPLFVACLLSAIVLTNVIPRIMPTLFWPTRTRALALVSDLSLSIFLAMSLMSMQLWTLGGLGPSLLLILALQTVAAIAYILFVVFPLMGRNYDAAVIAGGFSGISLGATPTAIANMTAITKLHGAAPMAFIILPLVSAFFIDIANAFAIGFLVN